jgi:SAM-dependent methyltransferase
MPNYYRRLASEVRAGQPLRLRQKYVVPEDPNFETKWYEIFRLWIFKTYLSEVDNIYEFGCGSGFNIATLADLYPDKEIHGLDWAEASKEILEEMRRVHGLNIFGHVFDFFHPDQNLRIAPNSAVVTIGGLEQTGTNYEEFLQYILDSAPALVVHVEPIVEWYDSTNPIDHVAVRFHRKRKYLEGYLDRLYDLENSGRIEILKKKRAFFGSLYLEGWSQLIWKPVAD